MIYKLGQPRLRTVAMLWCDDAFNSRIWTRNLASSQEIWTQNLPPVCILLPGGWHRLKKFVTKSAHEVSGGRKRSDYLCDIKSRDIPLQSVIPEFLPIEGTPIRSPFYWHMTHLTIRKWKISTITVLSWKTKQFKRKWAVTYYFCTRFPNMGVKVADRKFAKLGAASIAATTFVMVAI